MLLSRPSSRNRKIAASSTELAFLPNGKMKGLAIEHPKPDKTQCVGISTFSLMPLARRLAFLAITVGPIIFLIFGGCCANVFALEAIVKNHSSAGTLITFAQFLLIAVTGYASHFSIKHPPFYLIPNRVPLSRWIINILLFFSVNVLNNYTFKYNISIPVHIILRSGGTIFTMALGWLIGKRFSRMQVLSAAILTVGVICAAMADSYSKDNSPASVSQPKSSFIAGLCILFLCQVLGAVLGLYIQSTYAQYGGHWQENIFYTHFLSLPLFIPFMPSILHELSLLNKSSPVTVYLPVPAGFLHIFPESFQVPSQILILFLNALTQYVCIRGVNLLSARSSAVTVNIVLSIRKLASLLISVWLFGNRLAPGVLVGAAIVFGSGALYAWESQRLRLRTMAGS